MTENKLETTNGTEPLPAQPNGHALAAAGDDPVKEHKARVDLMRRVMAEVMIPGVHYMRIPGTDKPALLKPGAEVAMMTFCLRQSLDVEDLSTKDCVRYRVRALAFNQGGVEVGDGVGECSSDEEKYRWRKAVCKAEYEDTQSNYRRVKYYKNGGTVTQVRAAPADVANTVLKMAAKRARVDLALTVCALSELFTQDMEERIQADRLAATPAPPSPKRAVFDCMRKLKASTEAVKQVISDLGVPEDSGSWTDQHAGDIIAELTLRAAAAKAEADAMGDDDAPF